MFLFHFKFYCEKLRNTWISLLHVFHQVYNVTHWSLYILTDVTAEFTRTRANGCTRATSVAILLQENVHLLRLQCYDNVQTLTTRKSECELHRNDGNWRRKHLSRKIYVNKPHQTRWIIKYIAQASH